MKNDPGNIELPRPERFAAWNRFWFSPADPTLLGLIRICCGLITLYTLIVYSFRLQEFMGADGWLDLNVRMKEVKDVPRDPGALDPNRRRVLRPSNPEEEHYVQDYVKKWGNPPPPPMPESRRESAAIELFLDTYKVDPRINGLKRMPHNERELVFLQDYMRILGYPPPDYPNYDIPGEEALIWEYIGRYNRDYRLLYARGLNVWSLWFDLTDPTGMAIVHGCVILIALLFTLGFCTRITAALLWMCSLWYIHRNNTVLFGVDTMQTILLLYLMIGPSGAALSVDRLIARWWSKNKLKVVNRWRGLLSKPPLSPDQIVPAIYSPKPVPSVSANVAYRLVQIHLCIIYFVAGLAKLLGPAWWDGTAVWKTLANYEFAPMQFEIYVWFLRQSARVQWVWHIFLTGAGYFTLAFEISYAFIVWRPGTRWWALGGAILLHGFIGLFMGLKTFSFMMLVMNMVFLKDKEVHWFLDRLRGKKTGTPAEKSSPPTPAPTSSASSTAIKENVKSKVKK